jgi:hypothetical protein
MKDKLNDFHNKSSEIRELAGLNPEELSNYLTGMNQNLDLSAPNLAPHMYASAINSIQYLHAKLPPSAPQFLQDELAGPSMAQKMKWLDIYGIANDPLSIFDFIEKGTVTDDQIQAVKTIFPALYQTMSAQILEQLGKMKQRKEQLPYPKRLAIAKFVGAPLDSTMGVQSLQVILKAAGPNLGPAAQANQNPKQRRPSSHHSQPSSAVLKQINKTDDLYKTQNQALEIGNQK